MPSSLGGSHLADALYGSPQHLGTIVATTTKNNDDTAVPFYNDTSTLAGRLLMLQADTAFHYRAVTTDTGTVTTGTAGTAGPKAEALEKVYIRMGSSEGWLACVAVSGTSNVQVWEMK